MRLRFDRTFEPQYGVAEPVAPGVRRITARNPGPFTFRGTNTYLVGQASLIVIDPGPDAVDHIEAIGKAIGPAEVKAILATHSHADHVAGARMLQSMTGASIHGGRSARMPSDAGPGAPLDAGNAPGFRPDHLLADGQIVETGEVRIRAIATPGHASDHFAFAIEESGVLFPGDHVMAWATTVVAPPDGSMGAYLKSIERLLGESATVYLPAHGGEIRDPHAYLRALRAHRRMRERAVLECLHAGERRIGNLVDAIYPDLDLRLRQAARATTLAHLDHLAEHGLVEAGGPPGDPVYRVAGRGTGTAGAGPDGSASSAGAASSIP